MSVTIDEVDPRVSLGNAGRLLHTLAPRAQVFCFYGRDKGCLWSSDGVEDFEVDKFVAELPDEVVDTLLDADDSLRRTLPSGRTVLALPVLAHNDTAAGIMVALFSRNEGRSSAFNPSLLKKVMQPAIEVIGESLQIKQAKLHLERSNEKISNELRLVYAVDEKIHGAVDRHSGLAELVGRSGRYLGTSYSVLLIPSKRIRISATHSSWKNINRKTLDRYLTNHLIPQLAGEKNPVVFEVPADERGDNSAPGYHALLCPLLDKQGNVEGVLAQLGRRELRDFSTSDRRFMSYIGRKVELVVEQSFDAMTGLMNRAGFESQLLDSLKTLKSDGDTHQLIYFNLDNLQLVNDTFSRKAGDEVILSLVRLLAEDLPKSAALSRLTGDHFCMLLTHASSEAALLCANAIRGRIAALRYLEGDKSLQVTMSIGIAEINRCSEDARNALTIARMACEAAKDHGSDRIEIYADGNRSAIRRYDDMQLVAEIQQALDRDEFELFAQPIISLKEDTTNPRFEILLRMHDSAGGHVDNGALFSAAERYRMMPQIDRWVVSATLDKLTEFYQSIVEKKMVIAINLSGQSLGDDDFLEFIEREIERSQIPMTALSFEITESAAVSNMTRAQSFIDRLRQRGCEISLDDFGAGLSSFAYLKNFKVDTLKIDGSFIRDIEDNRISESMVAAITQVARVMQLQTVAEYVETEAARKIVCELGVDFAQGHIIGKPIPLDSVLSNLFQRQLEGA